jgi:hypothetical protein
VQFCNTEVLLITFEIINLKTKNFEEIYLHSHRNFESFIISCSVVDQLLTFTISNQTTFKIPSTFPVGTAVPIPTTDITTNSSAEFENNNTKANLVKDVRLKELTVTITDPANKTFSF